MAKDEQEHHNNSNSTNSISNSNSEEEPQTPEIKSANYEKQRDARIAANNARLESLGLRKMSISLMGSSPNSRTTRSSTPKSKRVVKKIEDIDDDHEYQPNYDDNGNGGSSSDDDDDDDDDDFEEEEETFVRMNRKSSAKKVKNTKANSGKQVSVSNPTDFLAFMDEDEALKQAIALSLKYLGETSDLQQTACSKEKNHDQFQEDNTKRRKRKLFTSRVHMSEDDLLIHFCQIDEIGKGCITLRDVERMAATHDFCWTDKEISDMIRCFDSDCDGKLTLDDFRNIAQRCNMLQPLQAHGDS